jgi:hypothetical protein
VKNRFQSLPFKCNLQRYTVVGAKIVSSLSTLENCVKAEPHHWASGEAGLCRLNQVDP